MAGVQPPPLRSLDDFLLCSARFAVPDLRDLDRWNNRMINNLLYYQTNYLLSALGLLLIVGYFQPLQMFVGMTVVSIAFVGFVFAAENQATVRRFRRNHPYVCVMAVLLASYLFMSVLGGVAVFLFGIAFPVLTIFIHASVRLRNLKNKLENKLESIGLKRTPMGLLLEALGQEQEAGS
ncbi:PRA1 family protein 3 [Oryzias melastigma]|uniref:PRA1 family protein n=1 Tax=Oryzias melastigma TaxID=30732 RepID=A0A3B3DHB0_ORYME|nr:PRA1 family protein 2 [Oryzias melastigma]XP_024127589.1 PRA1 family protein 2 [Oryzias melastigma]KAF6735535.1 PRA1 family protein 3 [Oryzias melastigma]